MEKEKDFEILHNSYRLYWASGKKFAERIGILEDDNEDEFPDWQYYRYNLVFRAYGEFKGICMREIKDWVESEVCIDIEKYKAYIDGIEYNFGDEDTEPVGEWNGQPTYALDKKNHSGIDRESLFVKGHTNNFSTFLIYNKKFDVFRFHEYIQFNPATTGILKFIDELKDGASYGITTSYCQFHSAMKSLEYFWD